MQVGSLVELVNDNWNQAMLVNNIKQGVSYPVKGKIYTVREILVSSTGRTCIRLEEIVNPIRQYLDGPTEFSFWIDRFRELQPPMTVKIEEFISQEV